ncbi:MAG: N-acetylneuraminate synthase family protein [Fibrobacterales bacterium]
MAKFVSEVSSNHGQSLKRCFDFIDASSKIGCDAVKFQLFKVDELFSREILSKSKAHRDRAQWELPVSFLGELSQYINEKKMDFSCTPFYLKAVETLFPYIDFYKIASYELLWGELLKECAQTGKPVVLATGMATMDEVRSGVEMLRSSGCDDITILHCVSSYPVPPEDCNLRAIETIREEFNVKTGWSDHSVNRNVINRAVNRFNADMVEFHLDIDGHGAEFKSGHCWLPEDIGSTIRGVVNNVSKEWDNADGDGIKKPVVSEMSDVLWRADPVDGLRPFREIRESFLGEG